MSAEIKPIRRPTLAGQVRRSKAILKHVERLEPAMREWLVSRLRQEECHPCTLAHLRMRGWR